MFELGNLNVVLIDDFEGFVHNYMIMIRVLSISINMNAAY